MNEQKIWNALTGAGMTPAGAAAMMGNLKAESNLEPTNLQNTYERKLGYSDTTYTAAVDAGKYTNFAKDAAGYGLAQWTYHTRKAALLAYARGEGVSVGDLDMQLRFLVKELRESYPAVWTTLCMAQNVRTASDVVLLQFERPADTSEAVRKLRAGFGEKFLAELDGAAEEELPNPPCPGEVVDALQGVLEIGGRRFEVTVVEIV